MNENAMTQEREAKILETFVGQIGETGLRMFAINMMADLIAMLSAPDKDGGLRKAIAAAHFTTDALELMFEGVEECEIEFLELMEASIDGYMRYKDDD